MCWSYYDQISGFGARVHEKENKPIPLCAQEATLLIESLSCSSDNENCIPASYLCVLSNLFD